MILDSDNMIEVKCMLTAKAWQLSEVIEVSVTGYYRRINKKPKWETYPSVVAACCSEQKSRKSYFGFCYGVRARHLDKRLYKALSSLGKIGQCPTQNSNSTNKIGHCAEQHAANFLLKDQKQVELNDIYFGLTFRPRTGQCIPPCENCTFVFPTLR